MTCYNYANCRQNKRKSNIKTKQKITKQNKTKQNKKQYQNEISLETSNISMIDQ